MQTKDVIHYDPEADTSPLFVLHVILVQNVVWVVLIFLLLSTVRVTEMAVISKLFNIVRISSHRFRRVVIIARENGREKRLRHTRSILLNSGSSFTTTALGCNLNHESVLWRVTSKLHHRSQEKRKEHVLVHIVLPCCIDTL